MKMFALFSDPDDVEDARNELETEGYGDAVVRVITGTPSDDAAEGTGTPPAVAGGTQSHGMVATNRAGQTAPEDTAATLDEFSLEPDEREYISDQLADGSQLMVLEPDEDAADGVRRVLESHAARVMSSDS